MEREANYLAVGTFILLVLGMGIAFVLWYTDANDGREYNTYEIQFAGSVSGLDRGSPVRYLGVDVGRVRRLGIDRDDPTRVVVVAEIASPADIGLKVFCQRVRQVRPVYLDELVIDVDHLAL